MFFAKSKSVSESTRRLRRTGALWVLALAALSPVPAFAQDAPPLPTADDQGLPEDDAEAADRNTIIVTASTTLDSAKKALESVPGGASLIDSAAVEKGRVLTNQDVLAFQPGVYAQAANGGDGLKISIRGSAVNRGVNFFRTGILFEFDGLPVTGPGGTPYELFEPLGLRYTEVLRGANGFDHGSSYLGGAINYVTNTGKDAERLQARVEGGSYGYFKGQLASGGQYGDVDYYVSATYGRRNGYQINSASENFGVLGNIGFQLTPDIETRFYVRYRQTENGTPGAILQSEVDNNPRAADPLNIARKAVRIQPGSVWIANKTSFTFGDDSVLSIGAVYHDYPIDIETQNSAIWAYTTLSGVLNYTRTDTLFGRDSVTTFGILSADNTRGWQATYNRYTIDPGTNAAAVSKTPAGTLTRFATYDGADRNIHLSNISEPLPGLKVTLGAALLNIYRATKVVYPATYEDPANRGTFIPNQPYSRNSWDYTVRYGLQYAVAPDVQLYGNVSRSVEPANDWSHLTVPPSFISGVAITQARAGLALKDQTAWTVEVGARGNTPIFGNWEISLYRAWVRNELLSVIVDEVNRITAESNASPTIHQGVEIGFDTALWRSADDSEHNITTRHSYTFNDFYFRNDRVFGDRQLPSLPRHFYQGEITYNHPSGAYLTGSVQAASAYYVDYANRYKTKGYAIFGATAGYAPKDGDWSLFVDLRNIGDKGYVAAISPVYDSGGIDTRRASPGDGFSVIAGLSVKLK
jgi:iron complex outermembrane receptor protein